MPDPALSHRIASLPKAELHLHLEGSIQPATVRALAARHGVQVHEEEVRLRYAYQDFAGFLEAFKWVTSFLRDPDDYALITRDLGEQLLAQNIIYVEVTLSVGVMLLRKQQSEANFEAILRASEGVAKCGLQMNWIFDAVRQFGPEAAARVLQAAQSCACSSVVAFGIGGDELSTPTSAFRPVYEGAAELGLHRVIHAGEIGGPEKIREAVELLGVERIGHGIAAMHDPALRDLLTERRVALEVCPQSNLCTGALARQLRKETATLEEHPLPALMRHGVPVVLSTDDPAMFHTTLANEYDNAARMGLAENELLALAQMSFDYAFSGHKQKLALGHSALL